MVQFGRTPDGGIRPRTNLSDTSGLSNFGDLLPGFGGLKRSGPAYLSLEEFIEANRNSFSNSGIPDRSREINQVTARDRTRKEEERYLIDFYNSQIKKLRQTFNPSSAIVTVLAKGFLSRPEQLERERRTAFEGASREQRAGGFGRFGRPSLQIGDGGSSGLRI